MLENLLSGLIGALAGTVITLTGISYIDKRRRATESKEYLLDGVRLDFAKKLLEFLSMVLNKEAPESLKNQVPRIRKEWGSFNRQMYLLNAPYQERRQFDENIEKYFDSLKKLAKDPSHRPKVEEQRIETKQQARELLRLLGLTADW
ncbi:MAG: hypothetical protein AYK19_14090 [Theionarchaea archaeon DG-70-1]|nr:MAG: hypothetical protein AYK19_14090 [Theionarchaea archaeon DG-70-1]